MNFRQRSGATPLNGKPSPPEQGCLGYIYISGPRFHRNEVGAQKNLSATVFSNVGPSNASNRGSFYPGDGDPKWKQARADGRALKERAPHTTSPFDDKNKPSRAALWMFRAGKADWFPLWSSKG